ncbi:MAG: prolyl oligopeptidase family serine peptidase [Alphaproteobacteria bacterium]|nr:prolyl oligopeptidase family serine peptidase [Alphaproteobacteria bacterium]
MRNWFILLAALAAFFLAGPAGACGPDTECRIGDRFYLIRMPEGHDGKSPVGAIVYAHGYRGTATGVMRNQRLAAVAQQLNVALIATKSAGLGWSLPGSPGHSRAADVDELDYFDRVIEDVVTRFPVDRKRLVAAGFSAGGMMVWHLACYRSERFAGFVPIAGTFWVPVPDTCATPAASIVHIHGSVDRTVPLNGRVIREAKQGEVPRVIDMYAGYGGFGPAIELGAENLACKLRTNAAGRILNFCLFEGGHVFDANRIAQAWQMLTKAGSFPKP